MSLASRLFILLLSFSIYVSGQEGWMPGVGPTLATSTSLKGVNARAYYGVNERFCFGPELSVFPYQEISDEYETSLWEANFNAHYLFELAHRLGTYPLGGLNYTSENERSIIHSDEIEKQRGFGINYGLGLHYNINRVLLFTEFKGVVGELSDEFFTIGVVVLLRKQHSVPNQNH